MREEIAAAVLFLKRVLQKCESLPAGKVEKFSNCLSDVLADRFRDHWYKEKPTRGQGYRCISMSPAQPLDPVLEKAANESGICLHEPVLPMEIILWVDPFEVCCRIGDIRSNYCTVATMKNGSLDNKAETLDVSDLIRKARELYNRQLNITTTRVNATNNNSSNGDRLDFWQSLNARTDRSYLGQLASNQGLKSMEEHFNFESNFTENDFNGNQNNNSLFQNHNMDKHFNTFSDPPPFALPDHGQPFIPPDFSIPPPPLGMKLWQAPGAYSPPAKNKNLNSHFNDRGYSSKSVSEKSGSVKNERFHWQKNGHKVVS